MTASKTVLESLLLDDRAERVRSVAGLTYVAAYGVQEIGRTLAQIEEALKANDLEKAQERVNFAKLQVVHWHKRHREELASLVLYGERGIKTKAGRPAGKEGANA